jgi:uncharacterized protein (DUF488 family)
LKIENATIWTIGHSTRSIEEFLSTLKSFDIELIVDVRHYPGSRKFSQYNQEPLQASLHEEGIDYLSLVDLGGRRKPKPDSKNTIWRNDAFRGYADYMEAEAFKQGILRLTELALQKRTAYMCSEAVWWRCHRALISDHLKEKGWRVMHIMKKDTATEHPFTSAYLSTHPETGTGI